jgi:hypothetical protein
MQAESFAREMASGRESDIFEFCSGAFGESKLGNAHRHLSGSQYSEDNFFNVEDVTVLRSSLFEELDPRPCDNSNNIVASGANVQNILQVDAFKQTVLARRKRAVLTAQTAEDIYRLGAALTSDSRLGGSAPDPLSRRSTLVAQLYGISPKAVRDIWNRHAAPSYRLLSALAKHDIL